ncbi:MAG: DeoR/GlpR transcriptional regulator [Anaerolineae bacterium]|nr:DeoR/GlpR transcriptional regulator [Anaerolineae bacterium]
MPRKLFRQERLDSIIRQLRETGYVSVAELSEIFGVSAVTIRSDLDLLERTGYLLRTHGGAVPINLGESVLSFAVRQRTHVQSKERIGAAAAKFVSDGEAIVLDASTTAWHMARFLLSHHDLTVLTTGLYVALELLRSPSISVLIPGGPVWREAAAVVGSWENSILQEGNLQKGFFSGRGLSLEEGLTDANQDEVALKRKLIAAVREVNVLVDASKLGKVAFASCASLEEIDRVFTNREAPEDFVSALRNKGIEVILV